MAQDPLDNNDARDVSRALLGPAEIRELAARLGVRPTKTLGQNFLHDPNTIRRIVRTAKLEPDDVVLEVGPGLGSLTLGLLPAAGHVVAVELDGVLAEALPHTVRARSPLYANRLSVIHADALRVADLSIPLPTSLVANLPYNIAVPVVLHLLATFESLQRGLVMVQAEVAARMSAKPGSKIYGVPSVKMAWYAQAALAGSIPRSVFWPVPNVDSGLVAFQRREPPTVGGQNPDRERVFTVVDTAFAQRRKTLRAALARWAGSAERAEAILCTAGIDPKTRGERLGVEAFAAISLAEERSA